MMPLPVFVLAERATVPGNVASTAGLAGFAAAVPTALKDGKHFAVKYSSEAVFYSAVKYSSQF